MGIETFDSIFIAKMQTFTGIIASGHTKCSGFSTTFFFITSTLQLTKMHIICLPLSFPVFILRLTLLYGQESPGWISLYKLGTYFSFFWKIYRNINFFGKKRLVNEFQTAMGGGLLGISKKLFPYSKLDKKW